MNDVPAIVEMPPLSIIGHCPPSARRWNATNSWIRPDTIAHAPQTRRTAAMSEVAAKARPTPASTLTAMFR